MRPIVSSPALLIAQHSSHFRIVKAQEPLSIRVRMKEKKTLNNNTVTRLLCAPIVRADGSQRVQ